MQLITNTIHRKTSITIFLLILLFAIISCENNAEDKATGHIAINSPTDGEVLIEGAYYLISYSTSEISLIDIELYEDGAFAYTIAKNIKPDDGFRWEIEQGIHNSLAYNIKIVDANNRSLLGSTTEVFNILPAFKKSSFTDTRDGMIYATLKIGDLWWTAENFRFESEGSSYYFDVDSLGAIYGRMYTLESAKNSAPEGWHLPSDDEWKTLERTIGVPEDELELEGERSECAGDLLKADGGSGFNALYGGYNNFCANRYGHIYQEAHFWTSTLTNDQKPIIRVIGGFKSGISRLGSKCHSGCSVRYVKDY